jgi:hypothetical protein
MWLGRTHLLLRRTLPHILLRSNLPLLRRRLRPHLR